MATVSLLDISRSNPERYKFGALFTPENYSPKTDKGVKLGYRTGIMYFAPSRQSGYNVCQYSSDGCEASCLNEAGQGGIGIDFGVLVNDDTNTNPIQKARNARTRFYFECREAFCERLVWSVEQVKRLAARDHRVPCVRLNGTSDLPWERIRIRDGKTILQLFPTVQFYDYTKNPTRALKHARGGMPENYHLTFSRSEVNQADCQRVLDAGGSVAVVLRICECKPRAQCHHSIPDGLTYLGYRVISGDEHDLRFTDPRNVVVGLKAKGPARIDTTGFVVDITECQTRFGTPAQRLGKIRKARAA